MVNNKEYAVFVVPTGVGAAIGGYAGDASCVARKLSKKIPLIVNPNVVNAASFSGINENMLYVEGWALTEFFKNNIGLEKTSNNKIGVIFDSAIPEPVLNVHINTINAIKTVYGINIVEYILTDEPVGVNFYVNEVGISVGGIKNETSLLKAATKLKNSVDAIAVVCYFDEPDEDNYEIGQGVDVIGGVEGIISHYLSSETKLPCVHAPAFADLNITTKIVNPKASAEYITPTFLPCLFFGLENAPRLAPTSSDFITIKNVKALILPINSLGNSLVFDALKNNIPVIAVDENKTVLNVTADKLGLTDKIVIAKNYDEVFKLL